MSLHEEARVAWDGIETRKQDDAANHRPQTEPVLTSRSSFVEGFKAAAESRDQRIKRLREAIEPLRILAEDLGHHHTIQRALDALEPGDLDG